MNSRWIRLGLSILGIGGVGLTSWVSIKCHEKAKKKTEKKEKLIAYLPAIGCGVGTAACILGSNHLSDKEIAALTASCGYLAASRDKIKAAIERRFGKDALMDITSEANVKQIKEEKTKAKDVSSVVRPKKNLPSGHGMLKCYESYSGKYFYSTLEDVKEAENEVNRRVRNGECVTLNDFYKLLGINGTTFGDTFEWEPSQVYINIDEHAGSEIDEDEDPIAFENSLVEDDFTGETVLIIDVYTYPIEVIP